jgi:hypothetical protein
MPKRGIIGKWRSFMRAATATTVKRPRSPEFGFHYGAALAIAKIAKNK